MSQSPRNKPSKGQSPTLITPAFLRRHPLPRPDGGGDKNVRGSVLIIGGSPTLPGAVILAATAALRAGAGRLRIMTGRSIAQAVGVAVPESMAVGLDETDSGALAPSAADQIVEAANGVDAVLLGPGMEDPDAVAALLALVVPRLDGPTVVLDAAALAFVSHHADGLHGLNGRAILTPHATEMALLLGIEKNAVTADPPAIARRAAAERRAVTALKGAQTFIATPDGTLYHNKAGNVGLATSGSGDTLAGIVAGLAARGAEPWLAAAWGVYLHAAAGDALTRRHGPLGFLARELLSEIPSLMASLSKPPK